jgi:dienelactone hydrolase
MEWIDALAQALGVQALDDRQATALLRSAREVAHRVERKSTPLAAYVMGMAVGGRVAAGMAPATAFDDAIAVLEATLPASGGESSADG